MCPSKLPERDGASLLGEGVREAVQAGKPLTQAFKEQVLFGDHDLQFTNVADPATLKVKYGVRCRKCGWYFRSDVNIELAGEPSLPNDSMAQVTLMKLTRRFSAEVDPDCATASLMAVVTAVHDR